MDKKISTHFPRTIFSPNTDSLKKVPGLKQMVTKDALWYLDDRPYSGRYIDYYNSGRIQNEGVLLNGKLHGKLIVYFKNVAEEKPEV